MADALQGAKFSRFATWMSTFPFQSHAAIRLHEIAWMHLEPGADLQAPPLERLLFAYILKGEGQMLQEGQLYSFHKGDGILFNMANSFKTTALKPGLDFVSIQMSSALAETLFGFIRAERGAVIPGGPELLGVIEQIYALTGGKWSARADIEISAALYRLLGLLHTQAPGQGQTDPALVYIHGHYMEELPLEKLAVLCGMSLYHFIRCFKRDSGLTPHAYIRAFRIRKARELLAQSDLPIAAVANLVGYGDASHFSALFRCAVGCLPREYRRLYHK